MGGFGCAYSATATAFKTNPAQMLTKKDSKDMLGYQEHL
jgi:hypothetical protein